MELPKIEKKKEEENNSDDEKENENDEKKESDVKVVQSENEEIGNIPVPTFDSSEADKFSKVRIIDEEKENRKKKIKKIFKWILCVVFVLALIAGLIILFFLFWPYKTFYIEHLSCTEKNYCRVYDEFGTDINLIRNMLGLPFVMPEKGKNSLLDVKKEVKKKIYDEYDNIYSKKDKTDAIVAVTANKSRFKYFPLVVYSILKNTALPKKIVLVVYRSDAGHLTPSIKKMKKRGIIEIMEVKRNLKASNKLYYVAKQYKESPIIAIDAEHIYPSDLIKGLLNSYKNYPKAISARRAKTKRFNEDGTPTSFRLWGRGAYKERVPNYKIYAIHTGGVLYPPDIFKFDEGEIDLIRKYRKYDDVLLNYFSLKNEVQTVFCPPVDIISAAIFYERSFALNYFSDKTETDEYYENVDYGIQKLIAPIHKKWKNPDSNTNESSEDSLPN